MLADLPGPKIRAGAFPDGGVSTCRRARPSSSCPAAARATADTIDVEYPTLLEDLDAGDRVVIGDGAITMRVVAIARRLAVRPWSRPAADAGTPRRAPAVASACGCPSPTDEDLVLAEAVAAAGVEFIAVSFVRRAADVEQVRAVVGDRAGSSPRSRPARRSANLAEIIAAADAVMVARGDLGIDCPMEDVPHLQKQIVRHCVEVGMPVITATQMLESMIDAPSPTRAEVSDVANAVFDGTDALMLSGETAIGHDPALVVATMARIAERAEVEASYRQWAERLGRDPAHADGIDARDRITAALTHAAWQAAHDAGATAILCCTRSGRTARAMARFRPSARLIGLSPDPQTVAR